MPTTAIPVQVENPYRLSKWGYYGELGAGGNAKIRFLQTVITHDELDYITLISNIPGSEKWDVRDLFQRDVDDERVTKDIIPYFEDQTKVKFFNPLTLIILPMDENKRDILKSVEFIEPKIEKDIYDYDVYEKMNYFKFRIIKDNQSFAQIQWNDRKCHIVAIDGQHRLSGLKRWKNMPKGSGELITWRIPVVILSVYKVDKKKETANLLEVVRRLFVYINTRAVRLNKAREILLDDESINTICTQELIQYSHENDNKPLEARDNSILPLMFYDWRGETSYGLPKPGPAAIKSIEEIKSWYEYFIFGDDYKEKQESQLELKELAPPLNLYRGGALSYEDSLRVRQQFRKLVMPGFLYLMQNFLPYKNYILECRKIEKEAIEKSDLAQYAFMQLRFGSHNAPPDQQKNVIAEFEKLVNRIDNTKQRVLPSTIGLDIGMRGLIYAFAQSRDEYKNIFKKNITWLDHAKWCVAEFNEMCDEGWFKSYNDLEKRKRNILTHIIFDESGSIINYKLEHVEDAFGSLLILLLFHKKWLKKVMSNDQFENMRNTYGYNLRKTIEKGCRKAVKAELKDTFKGTIKEFDIEVKKKAEIATKKRWGDFEKYLGV